MVIHFPKLTVAYVIQNVGVGSGNHLSIFFIFISLRSLMFNDFEPDKKKLKSENR